VISGKEELIKLRENWEVEARTSPRGSRNAKRSACRTERLFSTGSSTSSKDARRMLADAAASSVEREKTIAERSRSSSA
jgi:hypothetical protein